MSYLTKIKNNFTFIRKKLNPVFKIGTKVVSYSLKEVFKTFKELIINKRPKDFYYRNNYKDNYRNNYYRKYSNIRTEKEKSDFKETLRKNRADKKNNYSKGKQM